jgi:hypothetical protein
MNEYSCLIKKIRTKRIVIKIVFIIAFAAELLLSAPLYIDAGILQISRTGLNPILALLLLIVTGALFIVAYAIVSVPIYNSMMVECDPKKYIALGEALSAKKEIPIVCAVGYTFLGEFARAEGFAVQMTGMR